MGGSEADKNVSPQNQKYCVSSTQRVKIDRLTGHGAAESLQNGENGQKVSIPESNRAFPKTLVLPNECNRELSFFFGLQAHYTRTRSTRHVGAPLLSREVQ